MTYQLSKILFIISLLACCNLQVLGKDKFLPIKLTDHDKTTINIDYDKANRIKEIRNDVYLNSERKDSTVIAYLYYPNGMLKEENSNKYIIENDTLWMTVSERKIYNNITSDSIISFTSYKQTKTNDVIVNDTINDSKIFLNKNKLPYRKIYYNGKNKFMETNDSTEYDENNEAIKNASSMTDKFGGLSIYISTEILETIPQKNIFMDVNPNSLLPTSIQNSFFFFFTEKAPSLLKLVTKTQENNPQTSNIKFTYQLDKNGYPVEVNSTEMSEGEKQKENTLYIEYKKVK